MIFVVFGGGISIGFAGIEVRSTTIDFPAIGLLLTGLGSLFIAGQWREGLLVCVALLLAGAMAEVVLRVFDHPLSKAHIDYAAWYQPSDYYGHELVAGFEGFGPLNQPVKINEEGFRDLPHANEKPAGVVRVLGLGDSFMFGWGVPEDETFLKQLERRLDARIDRSVESINAGVPGWGLNQYYLFLKRRGLQWSPDIVVLAYFVDDLSGPIQESIPPATQYGRGLQFKGSALHYSRLFNFMKSLSHLVREKNRPARVGYLHDLDVRRAEWSHRVNYLMTETAASETQTYSVMLIDHLQRTQKIVRSANAGLVLMYVPDISQLHHPEAQLINRILSKSCRNLSIPFVDMTAVFEAHQDPDRYYLWPKDPHTNSRGHAEMAAALEELICDTPELKADCHSPRDSAKSSSS
ncbi:MAG TPA: GDSL-type esterase/lipase family protein [Nitrospira sp.]